MYFMPLLSVFCKANSQIQYYVFYPDVDHHLSICEKVIQEQGKGDQTIMHCIFLGAAGVGKSCLMKCLLSDKVDIASRTSTQIAGKSV